MGKIKQEEITGCAGIEGLTSPPVIGETYVVPCVLGQVYNIGPHLIPLAWWPVILPSHQDTKYLPKFRTNWKDVDGVWTEIEETYYEENKNDNIHIHADPRFAPEENYMPYEIKNQDWHTILTQESEIEYREMICLRDMPVQRLFTGFGKKFVEDHKGKKVKCGRCPHKGVVLSSMPVIHGIITCPAHGLRFKEGRCVS